ncbi:MAG: 5'-nucleotidase, partial [Desulfovibrionaceae bacterium]
NLVADAMRAYWKGRADIAIMNGGTVRGSLPSGSVTTGDILASLPFENNLMLAEMKGSVLLAALEQGVSRHEEKTGSFPQVSGMRYTFNPANARGRRIVSAQVLGRDGSWLPVRPNAVYGVATGSFLAGGGDGYSMFVGLGWMYSEQNLSDVVREYIRSHTPVHVQLEHRITRQ